MLVKICKPSGHIIKLDHDDWVSISGFKTYIDKKRKTTYAITKKDCCGWGKYLHRIFIGAQKGQMVDHINGDGLDCRKSNLRICTNSQNLLNRGKNINNTCGFKGVSFHKKSKKNPYYARIFLNGKNYNLGSFKTAEEAAKAYDLGCKKFHLEFSKPNF